MSSFWQGKLLVSDIDGTLILKTGELPKENRNALEFVRSSGGVVALATGRNYLAAQKVVTVEFPIDYLIVGTGGAVLSWPQGEILRSHSLCEDSIQPVADFLIQREYDFFLQHPFPDNHRCYVHQSGSPNVDVMRRLDIYREFATELDKEEIPRTGSQFLVVIPNRRADERTEFEQEVFHRFGEEVHIVWSTSPLDGSSLWLEILPRQVSKGQAVSWLKQKLGLNYNVAIGNDYNDLDMLESADKGYVVGNARDELKQSFEAVGCFHHGGVAMAIERITQRSAS